MKNINIIPKEQVRERIIENTEYKIKVLNQALKFECMAPKRRALLEKQLINAKIKNCGFYTSN